jgi:hypothetical protein
MVAKWHFGCLYQRSGTCGTQRAMEYAMKKANAKRKLEVGKIPNLRGKSGKFGCKGTKWGSLMTTKSVFIVRDKNSSVPSDVCRAERASHDHGTGTVEFFRNCQLIKQITLKPSEELDSVPARIDLIG